MPDAILLLKLLKKINNSTVKVHLDVDYNGQEFSWKLTRANIKAEELILPEVKEKKDVPSELLIP